MQQIISIHVGQCGVQIGSALWELLTLEHSIDYDGMLKENLVTEDFGAGTFFHYCKDDRCVPRALFIDLEPNVIDELKTGCYRRLFHPDQLINGTEDAANNFARGFYTSGRIIKNTCQMRLRREIEMNDRLHGIHIYRSLGGGTGSGMTATILEILSDIPKITKIEIPIHPSPHLSSAIVEPYNCILAEHYCMDDIDMTLLMDNEALFDVVYDEISIVHPTLTNVNRIVAQVCSSITSSIRFYNNLSNDFTVMTNLVPYPRIHYPLVSYAPFGNSTKLDREVNSVIELTLSVFKPSNQLVKCDASGGKYMSCSLLYRGSISPPEVHEALSEIKMTNNIRFVDWCPTGFKVGIVNQEPYIIPQSQVGETPRNVIMMTNNSAVSVIWHRLSQKFHKLYSKRSFVHWFVSEGLEETEFCESLFNLATLAKDYEEVSLDTEISDEMKNSIMGKCSTNSVTVTESSKANINVDLEPTMESPLKSNPEGKITGLVHRSIEKESEIQNPFINANEDKTFKSISGSTDKRVEIDSEDKFPLPSNFIRKISKTLSASMIVERGSKVQNTLISSNEGRTFKSITGTINKRLEIEPEDPSFLKSNPVDRLSKTFSGSLYRNTETEPTEDYLLKTSMEDKLSKISSVSMDQIVETEQEDLGEYLVKKNLEDKISYRSMDRVVRVDPNNEIHLQSYPQNQVSRTLSGLVEENIENDSKDQNSSESNPVSKLSKTLSGSVNKNVDTEQLVQNSLKSNPGSKISKTLSGSIERKIESEQLVKNSMESNPASKLSKTLSGSIERKIESEELVKNSLESNPASKLSKSLSGSIERKIESEQLVKNSMESNPASKLSKTLSGSVNKNVAAEQLVQDSLKSSPKSQMSKALSNSIIQNEKPESIIENLWEANLEGKLSGLMNRNENIQNETLLRSNVRSRISKRSSGSLVRNAKPESNNGPIISKTNFGSKQSKTLSDSVDKNEKLEQNNDLMLNELAKTLSNTIEKVIRSAESYERKINKADLNNIPEENVTTDITEPTEENFIKQEVESDSETEIKSVTDTDTMTEVDSEDNKRHSSKMENKDVLIDLEKIGDFENEKVFKEINHEIQDNIDLDFDLENYTDQNKLQNNFSNTFLLPNNDSVATTDRDGQQLIQALLSNDNRSIYTDEFDLFLEKYSSNSEKFNSRMSKKLSLENKLCSRFALLNSKSKLNRRCHTSLGDFGSGRDEEGTYSLMEELIRITAEINI